MIGSIAGQLPNKTDIVSLLWNTLIYGAGQGLGYCLPLIPGVMNFGVWQSVVGLGCGVVLKFLNKWVSDNTKPLVTAPTAQQ